jgi:sterol 3beta-glucosyltransferase
MRISIETWGSDGDIRPLIALAGGLRAAGHDVKIAVTSVDNKDYSQLCETLDVQYIRVPEQTDFDPDDLAGKMKGKRNIDFLKFIMQEMYYPYQDQMYQAAESLCRDSDVMVSHFLAHPMKAAALKTGTPLVTVILFPGFVRTAFAPPPGLPNLGPTLNRLGWRLARAVVDLALKKDIQHFWTGKGLPPFRHVIPDAWHSERLNLLGISSVLCPEQPDWEARFRVCGFFAIPDEAEPWTMPAQLKDFLSEGEPPVYMTLGTAQSLEPDRNMECLIAAARKSGCRALIQTSSENYPANSRDETRRIYFMGKTPHHQIFPRCAAVVHHGGSGTTHSAARSGCPSVVVPFTDEQRFWGATLHRHGIACKPIWYKRATPEKLTQRIRSVLASLQAHQRAALIGERICQEDGVAQAVKLIEETQVR